MASAVTRGGSRSRCGSAFERQARKTGARFIAGVDEVGRGALAGPVVAGAVILDFTRLPKGIDDSKRLPRPERERLDAEIRASALAFAVARVEADEIDRINILEATRSAMMMAIGALAPQPDFVLIDAVALANLGMPHRPIIHGDSRSLSIAAASIIAKVARDAWMRDCERSFPGYGFETHVGYATQEHLRSLRFLGPSQIHRLSFHGVDPEPTLFDLYSDQEFVE